MIVCADRGAAHRAHDLGKSSCSSHATLRDRRSSRSRHIELLLSRHAGAAAVTPHAKGVPAGTRLDSISGRSRARMSWGCGAPRPSRTCLLALLSVGSGKPRELVGAQGGAYGGELLHHISKARPVRGCLAPASCEQVDECRRRDFG